jgi:prepilin-type processing-associated H-X9-DG protein
MSWMVQILPYIDQPATFAHFDFTVGAYDEKNEKPAAIVIPTFICPSEVKDHEPGMTSYAGCHHDVEAPIDVDNHGVLFLNSSIRYRDIADGATHTIFAGELIDNYRGWGWASGTRATLRNTGSPINASVPRGRMYLPAPPPAPTTPAEALYVGGFASCHPGGAQFLFGDGSVKFLSTAMSLPVLQQLGHRADGELPLYGEF